MRALPLLLLLPTAANAGKEPVLTPLVQLQLWGTVFDQDEDPQADPAGYGDPEADPGFSVQRARLGFEGQQGNLDFQLEAGIGAPYDAVRAASSSSARFTLQNAFARGTWAFGPGSGRAAFGLVRVPFGRERIMSSRELVFQERAVSAAWLAPSQDLGLLLDYEFDAGPRAQIGIYNGGGDLFGDNNTGMMVAGRLEYANGDVYRTYGQADGIDFGAAAAGYWNDDLATDTVGWEGDLLVRVWRVTFLVEVMGAFITPGDSTVALPEVLEPTRRFGVTSQVSYWQPVGEATDSPASRSAVEFAAQLATYDDNTALVDNGQVAIVHVGATWRNVVQAVDIGAGFIHREELGGRTLPNDTARIWGQLRWPARGIRTTGTPPEATVPLPTDIPRESQVHPEGPR
jgi:hypothetical protein